MATKMKKLEIWVLIIAAAIIIGTWAANGFDDTWLYVTALIIAIPVSWFGFNRTDKVK